MSKNIQLPQSFFLDVYRLISVLKDHELDGFARDLCVSLESQIMDKFAAMDRRNSFSKYKTASPSSAERELYRREYLDKAGLHKDWVSNSEVYP